MEKSERIGNIEKEGEIESKGKEKSGCRLFCFTSHALLLTTNRRAINNADCKKTDFCANLLKGHPFMTSW